MTITSAEWKKLHEERAGAPTEPWKGCARGHCWDERGPRAADWKLASATCIHLFPHQTPALLTGPTNLSLFHPFQEDENVFLRELENLQAQITADRAGGEPGVRLKTSHLGKNLFSKHPFCLCSQNRSVWINTSQAGTKGIILQRNCLDLEKRFTDSIWNTLCQVSQLIF